MRLTIDYEMSGSKLPRDYLRGFISLIKASFDINEKHLVERFYNIFQLKPFTFGVYFPELKGKDGEEMDVGNKIKFNFSSSSPELVIYLYNGFCNIKEYPLFKNHIYKKNVFLHPNYQIKNDEVIFRTISPFAITNKGDSNKFILNGEEGFDEGLRFSVNECAKTFLGINKEVEFEYKPIDMKKRFVHNYKLMLTNSGVFRMKAKPQILQMFYDVGIGVHRSQGFGMLEVIG